MTVHRPPPSRRSNWRTLVGRIALYPDDLVAIILPASTYPLDIVQADRFLQKVKQDKNLKPDQRWDESIRNLLNYPEVISMMSQDIDWTQDLGEAVVSQQGDVLKAVQAFRAKAATAGNLKSDDKQLIVQENNVIQIVPADPEVIYVPQYQPSTVVVTQAAPVYGYYPAPYPSYYYPYPPGAALATGFAIGAATAWACNWGGGNVENNVNINNTTNMTATRNNQQVQQKTNEARQRADSAQAQRGGQAGQTGRGQAGGQAGQTGRGQAGASTWQSQKKPGEVSGGRVSPQTAQARPGSSGSGGASKGDAFGSGGRGSDATRDADRGAQSRGGSASTMDRGGAQSGGESRGGGSASTMDRGGGSQGGGGGASMGGCGRVVVAAAPAVAAAGVAAAVGGDDDDQHRRSRCYASERAPNENELPLTAPGPRGGGPVGGYDEHSANTTHATNASRSGSGVSAAYPGLLLAGPGRHRRAPDALWDARSRRGGPAHGVQERRQ